MWKESPMTPEMKNKIDQLSRIEMASMWRFEPLDSPYFEGATGSYFAKRFNSLGGWNPEISKLVGWK